MNKKANGQWLKAKSKAFPITSFAISAPVNVYSARRRASMSLSSGIIDFISGSEPTQLSLVFDSVGAWICNSWYRRSR